MNPYYNPSKFNLELLSFDDPHLSYEYNTLCFWATPDGRIFTASDSGCSCPTPFEQYDVESLNELLPLLERVGSVDQAESIFDSWNNNKLQMSDRDELSIWIKNNLK